MSQTQTEIAIRRYKDAYIKYHGRVPDISSSHGWIKINHIYNAQRPFQVNEMADRLTRMARVEGVDRSGEVEQPTPAERFREMVINVEEREQDDREESKERLIGFFRERWQAEERQREENVWDVREELKEQVKKQIDDQTSAIIDDKEPLHTPVLGWRRSIKKNLIVAFFNRLFEDCGNSPFDMDTVMNEYAFSGNWVLNEDDEVDCSGCDFREEHEYMQDEIEHMQTRISNVNRTNQQKNREIRMLKEELELLQKKFNELKNNAVVFTMDEVSF